MSFNKLRLVIVDDDASITKLLSKILEQRYGDRFTVVAFNEAVSANAHIDTYGADLVITDLDMPDDTGIELLKKAKKRNAYCQVYLVTGHSTSEALMEALEAGATDYLVKPIDQGLLMRVIADGIERKTRWSRTLIEAMQHH
jgi:two-component system response regulator YesN